MDTEEVGVSIYDGGMVRYFFEILMMSKAIGIQTGAAARSREAKTL